MGNACSSSLGESRSTATEPPDEGSSFSSSEVMKTENGFIIIRLLNRRRLWNICAGKNEFQHPKCVTFKREKKTKEEDKEEDAIMGGGSNNNSEEEAELTNYTSNPIFDQAVENAKKTETEMEIWIANATNSSVKFIDEVVSAIEDVATSGHFNVSSSSSSEETNEEDSTTAVVPVVQELQNDPSRRKRKRSLRFYETSRSSDTGVLERSEARALQISPRKVAFRARASPRCSYRTSTNTTEKIFSSLGRSRWRFASRSSSPWC